MSVDITKTFLEATKNSKKNKKIKPTNEELADKIMKAIFKKENDGVKKNVKAEINDKDNELRVTMSVPPRKIVIYKSQEDEETQPKTVTGGDIERYLAQKGYKDLLITFTQVINNTHKNGLNAYWVFKKTKRKRTKTKISSEK